MAPKEKINWLFTTHVMTILLLGLYGLTRYTLEGLVAFETVLQLALFAGLWAAFGLDVALWGVFMRLVATYNAIWAVNSFGHTYGYRRYESHDRSTNNWFLGLVTFGEGFHNNHHAHEKCAFHGHTWWEIDINGWIIRLLEAAGIATQVRRLEERPMPERAAS